MRLERRLHWLKVFSLVGFLLSGLLLYHFYTPEQTSLCMFGDYFVCSLTDTPYARIDGLFHFLSIDLRLATPLVSFAFPNALLFFLGFLFLFFATAHFQRQTVFLGMRPARTLSVLKTFFYILAGYSIFLTYIETYLLYTLCLLCFLITLLIFGSLLLLIGLPSLSSQLKKSKSQGVKNKRKR